MRYRAKPETFEAFRYYHDACPEWFCDAQADGNITPGKDHCIIKTGDEEEVRAEKGDYIIMDDSREIYPMAAELFEELFEKAE